MNINVLNLLGTENAGFIIIKQGNYAVIGLRKDGTYVAWSYHFENAIPSYYWGRYTDDFTEALEKFNYKEELGG